jgi:hypothetical protein
LVNKFKKALAADAEFTLYSYGHTPIGVTSNKELIKKYKLVEINVKTDEDGYVIDGENRTFKLPTFAKLYSSKDRSINMIVVDEEMFYNAMEALLPQKHFFAFRRNIELEELTEIINSTTIHELYEDDSKNEYLFDSLAKRQFDSFKETLRSLQARIPSQSMSFAMAMRTVGFLPWDTNITMVANSNVFIEGSDYDIDKVFSIMFHLNSVGLLDGVNDRQVVVANGIAGQEGLGFSVEEAEINNAI